MSKRLGGRDIRVGVIDYGAGNLWSLCHALSYVGAEPIHVRRAADLSSMTHVVLPGVGAFGFCADRLRATRMLPALEQWGLADQRPLLGICVGMQLLADSSEEWGIQTGLCWIGGAVTKLQPSGHDVRIPHVGWNTVTFLDKFGEFDKASETDFYFDHSYACQVFEDERSLGLCTHGRPFSAAIRRNNVVGVQFHPEKSQASGLRLLRSFLAL